MNKSNFIDKNYKTKYLKYKMKYAYLNSRMLGGSLNIEYIVPTSTEVNDHLTNLADRVKQHKIRLNTIMSPITNEIDNLMLVLLFNIRGTLFTSLNQINDLMESHKYAWDEKIKRIGKTNYDALSVWEKEKLDTINELTPRIH